MSQYNLNEPSEWVKRIQELEANRKEADRQKSQGWPQSPSRPCPDCGACPTCGRRGRYTITYGYPGYVYL